MHKRKGQWVVLSAALTLAAVSLANSPVIHAQEDGAAASGEVVEAEAQPQPVTLSDRNDQAEVEKTHTVKHGDYLYKIAVDNGVTVKNLQDWNNLKTNVLYSNQVLKVQAPKAATPAVTTPKVQTPAVSNAQGSSDVKTYTVKHGDYLYKIAKAHGVTVKNLQDWNNLKTNMLSSNQILKVQAPKVTTPQAPKTTTPSNQTAKTYTVKRGDYLYKIAVANGVTVADLQRWNNLKTNVLRSNQVLVVENPSGKTVTKPSTPKVTKPETPKVTTPSNQTAKTYTVKHGDYLYKIAVANGVTVADLQRWNNLKTNVLRSNQVLVVENPSGKTVTKPSTPKETKAETPKVTTPSNQSAKTYTVKHGDYLYKIAVANGVTVADLQKWNNLKTNVLKSNQVLVVENPSGKTVTKPSVKPTTPKDSKPETPKVTTPSNQTAKTYTVKRGDYLYKIAVANGVTVSDLQKWNNLKTNVLRSNQVLVVENPSGKTVTKPSVKPTTPKETKPETPKVTTPSNQTAKTYTVKHGDYLYKIAVANGVTVADLQRWNNLKTNVLRSNQVLVVENPSGKKVTSTTNNEKEYLINAPWYSQMNARHGIQAWYACAPVTSAMLLGSRNIPFNLKQLVDNIPMYSASNPGGQIGSPYTTKDYLFKQVVQPDALVNYLNNNYNAKVKNISNSTYDEIVDHVKNGRAVMYYGTPPSDFGQFSWSGNNQHLKLITGYNPKNGNLRVQDACYFSPYDGKDFYNKQGGGYRPQDLGAHHWRTKQQFLNDYAHLDKKGNTRQAITFIS
ncbi:LysM peptidoglycan-binding domain-containing protein [Facklamia hominis]|uniref:LysM peptidoglycan-binding domain-containing protein n=1 Tax=Facklamia hominis TaxID=178214 RepID=UPI0015E12070|nr:LysM peptidoglycan-binding domain-containing protein [Facklamia hominis]